MCVRLACPASGYIVYGPLALGVTTTMFESTPLYPDHNRYWQLIERHKLTTLYTAPTGQNVDRERERMRTHE